ncbi:MAG TPA: hypothetical protein P5307_11935, partial [Pirellulaceae bacterium]|nr:hypothetical protein [Pirellulaceae bacterium]
MSNRRQRLSNHLFPGAGRKRRKDLHRQGGRKLFLEALEARQLLAVGPQLIGIQPNNDALLRFDETDFLTVSPQELVLKFDEAQRFNSMSLRELPGQIQITRSNLDGEFEAASAVESFNTGNAVAVKFSASRLGEDQNGISLTFTKSNQGSA